MIAVIFGALALAYGFILVRSYQHPSWLRGVALVHLIQVVAAAAYRGDLPPAGWSSALMLASGIPALVAFVRPHIGQRLLGMLCIWCIASIGLVSGPQGRGVVQWIPWSIPHITLSIGALGCLFVAASGAAIQLRGHVVGLLLLTLFLVAIPLLSPRADAVYAFSDGAPVQASVLVGNLQGDSGLVRKVWAMIPGPTWPRQVGTGLLIFALMSGIAAYHAGRRIPRWVRLLGFVGAVLPTVFLVIRWWPGVTVSTEQIMQAARDTIELELSQSEVIRGVRLPTGPFGGGLGATAAALIFPLAAVALAALAMLPAADEGMRALANRLEQIAGQLATALLAGGVLTGMVWANFSWGGPTYPDPKLYAGITALLILGMWHIADTELTRKSPLPSWLMIVALLVLLWSVVGPSIGWMAPTLHNFGP